MTSHRIRVLKYRQHVLLLGTEQYIAKCSSYDVNYFPAEREYWNSQ
jgi:hypothetical protein